MQESSAFWRRHVWRGLIIAALLAIALSYAFNSVAYRVFSAPGNSMLPVIESGDHIYVFKYAYLLAAPKRGDIIVFWHPALNTHFTKRIAGLPGDRIEMRDGGPVINGVAATRREVEPLQMETGKKPVAQFEEMLPGGPTYRTIDIFRGFRDNREVINVPQGHYFVLGDNRDDSNDSRFAEIGFIPEDMIEGRVVSRYWSGREKRYATKGVH
jgi:signal peptidase I